MERRNNLSVFKPALSSSFEIYDGSKPRKIHKRKRWCQFIKMNAVRKYYEVGLTKAVKFLIEEKPEYYKDLTPSTLQYWVNKLTPELLNFKK